MLWKYAEVLRCEQNVSLWLPLCWGKDLFGDALRVTEHREESEKERQGGLLLFVT